MDAYVKLAKNAVKTYLESGETISPPKNLSKKMLSERAGVFVSIHKKSGELRGCIGTFMPTKENVAQEIIKNALAAALNDPRFPPVTEKDFKDLVFSVDVLSKPKPAQEKDLDPKKYGLIIFAPDGRRGLLLPNLPGVETAEQQLQICCQKAGISPREEVKIQTFTVKRHEKK